jgi:hypothetical protein
VDTAKRIYKDELVVTDANGRYLRTLDLAVGAHEGPSRAEITLDDRRVTGGCEVIDGDVVLAGMSSAIRS